MTKKLICLLLALISVCGLFTVFALAAGDGPIEMRLDVSKKTCSAVDAVSVKATVKNASSSEVKNIVVSAFESENLVYFQQSSNCVTIYGPSGNSLESRSEPKVVSLKPGYSFTYTFNVMIDSAAAQGKISPADMKSLETRAGRKSAKHFTTIYAVTGSGVSKTAKLTFGGVPGELRVNAYYGLTKENYDTVTQKQKPPETKPATTKAKKDTKTTKAQQKALHASARISGVPFINQNDLGYPNGCEAVSAVMVLRYSGYSVTVADITSATPKASRFYKKDGVWYGGDPFKGFVGDPRKTSKEGAYGCFAPPIVKAMKKYAGDSVKNISGCAPEELFGYIQKGMPVVVWGASGDNLEKGVTWKIVDSKGNVTDKTFTRIVHEHCMVLTGYDSDYVYLHNPSYSANFRQSKALFIKNFKILYSQAIVVE